MPTLSMHPNVPCVVCGCRIEGFRVGSFRINRHSLRALNGSLVIIKQKCSECGHPTPHAFDVDRWRLDAKSQAIVDEYGARKGWS